MKKKYGCFLIWILGLFAAMPATAQQTGLDAVPVQQLTSMFAPAALQSDSEDRVVIPLSDPNRWATLQVRTNGSIRITAHAGREIVMTAPGAGNLLRPDPNADGLRRLTPGRLSIDEENNVVTVRADAITLNFDIQVPARTHLKIQTTSQGGIDVDGIEGEIEVTSQNGSVRLSRVAGSVVAHSGRGHLFVTMTAVTPNKLMAFSTANGDVDLTLPADTQANLSMNTASGDIYTDFDIQLDAASETGAGTRRFDSLVALYGRLPGRREHALSGAVNGGGPEFSLRSANGNIYIRRAP